MKGYSHNSGSMKGTGKGMGYADHNVSESKHSKQYMAGLGSLGNVKASVGLPKGIVGGNYPSPTGKKSGHMS